jgi:hypothetical protein
MTSSGLYSQPVRSCGVVSRREHETVMYKTCYMLRNHSKEGRRFRENPNREALITLYQMQMSFGVRLVMCIGISHFGSAQGTNLRSRGSIDKTTTKFSEDSRHRDRSSNHVSPEQKTSIPPL